MELREDDAGQRDRQHQYRCACSALEGARSEDQNFIDKSMGLIVQGIEMDLMHPFDEPEFNRLGRLYDAMGRLKTLRLTIISSLAATSLATTTRVSWNSDDAALCDTDRPRRFHVCRGWSINHNIRCTYAG